MIVAVAGPITSAISATTETIPIVASGTYTGSGDAKSGAARRQHDQLGTAITGVLLCVLGLTRAGRAIRYGDGLIPQAPSAGSGSPEEFMPRLRQMAEEAGCDPQSLSVTLGRAPEDPDVLKRNRELGVTRMTVRLPPAKEDEILPILDRWAKLISHVKT